MARLSNQHARRMRSPERICFGLAAETNRLAAHSTVLRAGSVLPEEILSTLISSGWKRVPGDQLPSEPTMFSTMRSVRAEIVKKAFTSSADRMIDPSAT
jgi:hypothetical protein